MQLISAVCTLLDEEGNLHAEGMRRHLGEQWRHGMDGVLVGGTMGMLQLLADRAWEALVRVGVEGSRGRGQLLVGVGDASFDRTVERVRAVHELPIDGVVVLSPYFMTFSQDELGDYFEAIADVSRVPVYLYDLPARTRVKLKIPTVCRLAKHRNIRGIKVSDDWSLARQLEDALGEANAPQSFRVIPAQPFLVDVLAREGAYGNLDGVFSLAPAWTRSIVDAVAAGNRRLAAERQRRLTRLLEALLGHAVLPACTVLLNACGIPGSVAPRPMRPLTAAERESLLADPIVEELVVEVGGRSPVGSEA